MGGMRVEHAYPPSIAWRATLQTSLRGSGDCSENTALQSGGGLRAGIARCLECAAGFSKLYRATLIQVRLLRLSLRGACISPIFDADDLPLLKEAGQLLLTRSPSHFSREGMGLERGKYAYSLPFSPTTRARARRALSLPLGLALPHSITPSLRPFLPPALPPSLPASLSLSCSLSLSPRKPVLDSKDCGFRIRLDGLQS